MKRYLIIPIFIFLCVSNLFGQTKSIFYNEKGKLIADTNYKISRRQMEKFIPVEGYLAKYIADNVDYPEKSENIDDTGYVVISFKIAATDTLQQVRIEKAYEKKNYLSNEAKKVIKTLHIPKSAYSKHLRNKKYFLAISFQLLGKNYKHPGFIEIKHYKTPLLKVN